MKFAHERRRAAGLSALLVVALISAACGGGGAQPDADDSTSGGQSDKPVGVFLAAPPSQAFTSAEMRGIENGGRVTGLDYKIFNPTGYDPQQQYRALESAFTAKTYDAYIIHPVGPNLCKLVTDAIEQQHITVVSTGGPICGDFTLRGEELHTEGTLTFVGGLTNMDGFVNYWENFGQKVAPDQKILSLTGPEGSSSAVPWQAAQELASAKYPAVDVVDTLHTDYSVAGSIQQIQSYLQGHPEVTAIASMYINLTQAAVKALENLNLSERVAIYDVGADTQSVALVKQGVVAATSPYFPISIGTTAMQAIADSRAGKTVPTYIGDDGNTEQYERFSWIDTSNIDQYTPEY
ncbi:MULTISPECIES: sugar ABC transporter substrate-binding protein [unclassified Rhodococcus (in: high G+C Gram-positive bacteria)]|uniref:sugar ABC transporter substrate-binding protein n=1 Tax=unclassified Rhodococcus (in: high G+C Gram-positive bacteria) TaxID=192944 RepID=UPI00117A2497|nr:MULTISPECIES: sugar ABC transporter substrate-binding protein [unclassified Rhodococcus (in: high G+C Gram-positive bacteria)]